MHLWDILLIVMVSLQVLVAAYMYEPKWKAMMLTLPFPFSFAALAVGHPIQAVNVLAMIAMFMFMQFVRWFYVRFRLPIVVAISLSALLYLAIGASLSATIPRTESWFWISCILAFTFALLIYRFLPERQEEGDRTTLPLWIKLPLTVVLVSCLIWMKPKLLGAMTFFPMVGVFIAYEARKSLWTMGRQNAIVILSVLPMVIVVHLGYATFGLAYAILLGWPIFLVSWTIVSVWGRRSLTGRA